MIILRRAMKSQWSKFSTRNFKWNFRLKLNLQNYVNSQLTFSCTPWVSTSTNLATINFDHGISSYNCEWNSASELSQHFSFLLIFKWFRKIIDFDFVLRNFVQNLNKWMDGQAKYESVLYLICEVDQFIFVFNCRKFRTISIDIPVFWTIEPLRVSWCQPLQWLEWYWLYRRVFA